MNCQLHNVFCFMYFIFNLIHSVLKSNITKCLNYMGNNIYIYIYIYIYYFWYHVGTSENIYFTILLNLNIFFPLHFQTFSGNRPLENRFSYHLMIKNVLFQSLTDKATSQLLLETDWESILQICDLIRQGDTQ